MIIGNITNNIINIAIIVITSIKSKKDMLTRRTGGSLGIMRLVMAIVMLVNIKVIIKFKIKIILITQALCFYKYLVNEEEKSTWCRRRCPPYRIYMCCNRLLLQKKLEVFEI